MSNVGLPLGLRFVLGMMATFSWNYWEMQRCHFQNSPRPWLGFLRAHSRRLMIGSQRSQTNFGSGIAGRRVADTRLHA